ncbi:DUF4225 domain-containing protein [Enterobacter roggenkampii]|uniref:DUF4225 domain-containing protein n=1 Tax=Enterobacter TaxID=547 RepID=UPI0003BEC63B|nr:MULTISPECIES: DUF4225 domain-containing protein [Enterobacter]ELS5726536.1 DUF4225 domain-containing protein [Enterobacter roggenkampii]ELT0932317.1 DUF4225 domain-containing protein [Enterobacter roggenkampii]ESL70131.1 hypothetical protein L423_04289 [Enterobacter roggenkampii]KTH68212.1 hypothetical protein ASV20_21555 [Enterobacter roggenkampii]MBQ0296794.1 DUF4225 domain-containing protein [Enterobacter roggenkampii]
MDAALLNMMQSGGRNKAWAETMVNMEARKLVNTANTLSAFHLSDGLTRMKFIQEIRDLIEQQFTLARQAKSDKECMDCVKILREENYNLLEQARLLRTKAAKLYAKVEFIRENNKIVGYVISAVSVVLASAEIAAGFTLIGTMTPLGVLAGAILVTDGANSISKEVARYATNNTTSEGLVANAAMSTAEFMGFSRENGLGVYKSISLAANAYTIFGLLRRPGTWRLFRYLPTDYYRKVSTLSRPQLTMKIAGYGVKAKIIFDLLSVSDPSQN